MATLQGAKVVWGSGIAATAGIVTASKLYPQSAEYGIGGGEFKVADSGGETVARYFYDDEATLNLTLIPFDASTVVNAATNFDLPARGTKCTITASTSYEAAGTPEFAGDWMFLSGSKRLRNDGVAELTVNLVRNPGITPS